jgi:hypothetical protein
MHRRRGSKTIIFEMRHPGNLARVPSHLDRRRYKPGATYEKHKDIGNRSCGRSHIAFLVDFWT